MNNSCFCIGPQKGETDCPCKILHRDKDISAMGLLIHKNVKLENEVAALYGRVKCLEGGLREIHDTMNRDGRFCGTCEEISKLLEERK